MSTAKPRRATAPPSTPTSAAAPSCRNRVAQERVVREAVAAQRERPFAGARPASSGADAKNGVRPLTEPARGASGGARGRVPAQDLGAAVDGRDARARRRRRIHLRPEGRRRSSRRAARRRSRQVLRVFEPPDDHSGCEGARPRMGRGLVAGRSRCPTASPLEQLELLEHAPLHFDQGHDRSRDVQVARPAAVGVRAEHRAPARGSAHRSSWSDSARRSSSGRKEAAPTPSWRAGGPPISSTWRSTSRGRRNRVTAFKKIQKVQSMMTTRWMIAAASALGRRRADGVGDARTDAARRSARRRTGIPTGCPEPARRTSRPISTSRSRT